MTVQRVFQAPDDNGRRAAVECDQEQQGSGTRLFAAGLDGARGARAGHGAQGEQVAEEVQAELARHEGGA